MPLMFLAKICSGWAADLLKLLLIHNIVITIFLCARFFGFTKQLANFLLTEHQNFLFGTRTYPSLLQLLRSSSRASTAYTSIRRRHRSRAWWPDDAPLASFIVPKFLRNDLCGMGKRLGSDNGNATVTPAMMVRTFRKLWNLKFETWRWLISDVYGDDDTLSPASPGVLFFSRFPWGVSMRTLSSYLFLTSYFIISLCNSNILVATSFLNCRFYHNTTWYSRKWRFLAQIGWPHLNNFICHVKSREY